MHHVCVAIITLLHWTLLLLACFIIILVAIFTCFMYMFDVRLSYHNKRLLTYLLTYLVMSFTQYAIARTGRTVRSKV